MSRIILALFLTASTIVAVVAQQTAINGQASGQSSDQFLDGIGETSLIARYTFNGNVEDSSRNQLHGTVRGAGAVFVDDATQRQVLYLTGEGSHVQLPANAFDGEDALAVVGWFYLPTRATGPIFDFGQNVETRLYAVADAQGFRATAVVDGKVRAETAGKPVVDNQWTHFAVVLDPSGKVLTTYVDGMRAGQATNVDVTPAQLVPAALSTNRLFIGRTQDDKAPTIHARFRDVRLYRIALGDEPVATIRRNALAVTQSAAAGRGRGQGQPQISIADIPKESLFAGRLVTVPDISVETTVGMMPRLPGIVPATYIGGVAGQARVIWPSPTDNSAVVKPGTYTVSGLVPGTNFQPKATVIVKVPVGVTTPPARLVEAFPLNRVTLDRNIQGQDTPFIKNRDKFLKGLAASNPDNFLYNFRETFGQTQPEGTKALGGWDSQTTRLRGHATGHYLSAIAQAYASTGYDPALQAQFLQKMNYLVDTLYDLSQKSGKPAQAGGPAIADPLAVPVGPGRQSYDSNLRAGQIRTDYWNWGVGFISAYPPDQFIMLERGATYGGQDSQI